MAVENRLWGAERVRGELLKLGIRVAKRTVQKYMRGARPGAPRSGLRWRTFLRNHAVWACDFLQAYDIWFRPVFAFFVVDVNAKRVVHVAVTRAPTQMWTAQQLRNATPFGQGLQFIVSDRDDKFGTVFDRVAKGARIRVLRTAVQAPLMNSVCERFLGTVRRECLDHTIILSESRLQHVLAEYALNYFNTARPHQGIGQRIPVSGERQRTRARFAGSITAFPVLGGLHHDYRAAAQLRRMTKGANTRTLVLREVRQDSVAVPQRLRRGTAGERLIDSLRRASPEERPTVAHPAEAQVRHWVAVQIGVADDRHDEVPPSGLTFGSWEGAGLPVT
jgi:putative transposase